MKIYKYPILPNTPTVMPQGALLLDCHVQGDNPYVWALVDPEAPKEQRLLRVFATGEQFDPTGLIYVGSFHGIGGWMVFHLFEEVQA
jgi:hypothetical protein